MRSRLSSFEVTTLKPIIKRAYPLYWVENKILRIGAQHGLTRELIDPKGELKVMLPLLNGEYAVDDLTEQVLREIPHLTEKDVRTGLAALSSAGLLEDDELYRQTSERERANHLFFSLAIGDRKNNVQQQLHKCHVALLGLGGGGSACLPQILSLGVGELSIVDSDTVEMSNLNRQTLYRVKDIGRKKVDVSRQYCQEFAPECQIHAYDEHLDTVDSIKRVIKDADCVICAIDEPHFIAQRRVNAAIVAAGIPCVFMLSQHTCGRFFSVIPGNSGCMDCLHINDARVDKDFTKQFIALMHPYREGETAVIAPHAQRLSSFVVDEALRLTTHYAEPFAVGKQVDIDYITGNMVEVMSWSREEDCPTCGRGNPKYDSLFDIAPLEGAR